MAASNEPSVGDLLGKLATSTASLVRQEMQLASTEIANNTSRATDAIGMVGLGGAALHLGLMTLIASVVFALGSIVPMWLSALVLGGIVSIGGAGVLAKGLGALRHLDLVPRQTLKTLKYDGAWVKEQVR